MTYTYTCANCAEVVEFTCSSAEKDERERARFVRVFNALLARRADGSSEGILERLREAVETILKREQEAPVLVAAS